MGNRLESIYYACPIWMQNILVSAYGYKLRRKRYGKNFQAILDLLRESREWNQAKAEAYQGEKLFDIVRHCRQNVPYYQKLFSELGFHESQISSPADIARLPVLTKQELRDNIGDFRSQVERPYIMQHTSGSTGTPLCLEVNEYTYKLAMALLVDHEEHHGVPFGARRATFAGRMVQPSTRMTPPFARMNIAENQKLFSSYHLNEETFSWYHEELTRFQPAELIGYPSAISDLAAHYQRSGLAPEFRPTAIITNSETLLEWQRALIEQVFQCPVWDYYGTAEYVVFAGQEHFGYRLNPIIGVTELLADNAQPGAPKRLLATTLTNTAMPLLRYEIGDCAIPIQSNGQDRSGPVYGLSRIEGRVDDYIETADGRRIGRIDHIFKGLSGITRAQVVQKSVHKCQILIQKDNPAAMINEEILIENFRSRTGDSISIEITYVDDIPRAPNGKFKSVVRD